MIESLLNTSLGKALPTNIGQDIAKTRETKSTSPSVSGLSAAQNSLVDQIDINENFSQSLAQLQDLDRQLTRFLDVLKGNRSANSVINELNNEQGTRVTIAGFESRSALSISQIESIQQTTSLSAEVSNSGELDLILTNVRENISQTNFSLSTQQNSFFAAFS